MPPNLAATTPVTPPPPSRNPDPSTSNHFATIFLVMLRTALNARLVILLCACFFFTATTLQAQTTTPAAIGAQQGLYLVFPFENAGSSPRLDWLGEGLEELTIQYLSDGGEQVYSHAGRAGEFERYG